MVRSYASPESEFRPALTANVAVARVFARDFPGNPHGYRRELYADNTRGSGVLTLRIHASTYQERRVGVGGTLNVENIGPIHAYTLESTTSESAGVVTIYENGGLTEE